MDLSLDPQSIEKIESRVQSSTFVQEVKKPIVNEQPVVVNQSFHQSYQQPVNQPQLQTSVNRTTINPTQSIDSRPRIDSMAYQNQVSYNTQPIQQIHTSQVPSRASNKFSFSYQGSPQTLSQIR